MCTTDPRVRGMCRMCGERYHGLGSVDIFEPRGILPSYCDLLKELLGLNPRRDDMKPNRVGMTCARLLDDWAKFRRRCSEAQEVLHQQVENNKKLRAAEINENNAANDNAEAGPSHENRHQANGNAGPSSENRHEARENAGPSRENRHEANGNAGPSSENRHEANGNAGPSRQNGEEKSESNKLNVTVAPSLEIGDDTAIGNAVAGPCHKSDHVVIKAGQNDDKNESTSEKDTAGTSGENHLAISTPEPRKSRSSKKIVEKSSRPPAKKCTVQSASSKNSATVDYGTARRSRAKQAQLPGGHVGRDNAVAAVSNDKLQVGTRRVTRSSGKLLEKSSFSAASRKSLKRPASSNFGGSASKTKRMSRNFKM